MESSWIRRGACGLCEGAQLRPLPVPRARVGGALGAMTGLGLVRCAGCGMEQVEPRPSDAALAAFYQGQDYTAHEPVDDAAARRRAAGQLAAIERAGGPVSGARVLDVGCGGGQLLVAARTAGARVCGVDPAAHAHAACRRQGIEVVASVDALGEQIFDGIVMSHVLEHVPDVLAQLAQLRRLLSPGGWLCLEVPNRGSLRAQASPRWMTRLGADERHRAFPAHLWYFTPTTLTRALQHSGFAVALMTTAGLGVEALAPSWLGARLGQRKGAARPAPRAVGGEAHAEAEAGSASPRAAASAASVRSRVRSELKRRYFDALLGENLLVVARPG